MDETKTYIKMCDCPEIQKEWKAKEGDFFTVKHPKEKYRVVWVFDAHDMKEHEKNYYPCVFFPRQDQIQEMMMGWPLIKLFSFFFDFAHDSMVEQIGIGNEPKENPLFNSMEQLWLAFYMHEKHKKTWDGKKWIAELQGGKDAIEL